MSNRVSQSNNQKLKSPKKISLKIMDQEIEKIHESLDELVKEDQRNKTTFYLNQLSNQNMAECVQDISVFSQSPNFTKWFSRTLVQKRAALEALPMQMTYVHLLAKVNKKLLYNSVILETYLFLKSLLISKKERQNERNLLKNLGSFLGNITLARNRPIVLKYLNLKSLIVEAFHTHKLEKVIPLICRILEGIKYS